MSESAKMDYEKTAAELWDRLMNEHGLDSDVECSRCEAIIATALRSASTPPEGWKLVPVEATPAMLYAAEAVMPPWPENPHQLHYVEHPTTQDVYTAMLSASPSPPETTP